MPGIFRPSARLEAGKDGPAGMVHLQADLLRSRGVSICDDLGYLDLYGSLASHSRQQQACDLLCGPKLSKVRANDSSPYYSKSYSDNVTPSSDF